MEGYVSQEKAIARRAKEKGISNKVLEAFFDKKLEEVATTFPNASSNWRLGRVEFLLWDHFFPAEPFPGKMQYLDSPGSGRKPPLGAGRFVAAEGEMTDKLYSDNILKARVKPEPGVPSGAWVHDRYSEKTALRNDTALPQSDYYRPPSLHSDRYTPSNSALQMAQTDHYSPAKSEIPRQSGSSRSDRATDRGRPRSDSRSSGLSNVVPNSAKPVEILSYASQGQQGLQTLLGSLSGAVLADPRPVAKMLRVMGLRNFARDRGISGSAYDAIQKKCRDLVRLRHSDQTLGREWLAWKEEAMIWDQIFGPVRFPIAEPSWQSQRVTSASSTRSTGGSLRNAWSTTADAGFGADSYRSATRSTPVQWDGPTRAASAFATPPCTGYFPMEKVMEEKAKEVGGMDFRKKFFQRLQRSRDLVRTEHGSCASLVRHYLADIHVWNQCFPEEPFPVAPPEGGHVEGCKGSVSKFLRTTSPPKLTQSTTQSSQPNDVGGKNNREPATAARVVPAQPRTQISSKPNTSILSTQQVAPRSQPSLPRDQNLSPPKIKVEPSAKISQQERPSTSAPHLSSSLPTKSDRGKSSANDQQVLLFFNENHRQCKFSELDRIYQAFFQDAAGNHQVSSSLGCKLLYARSKDATYILACPSAAQIQDSTTSNQTWNANSLAKASKFVEAWVTEVLANRKTVSLLDYYKSHRPSSSVRLETRNSTCLIVQGKSVPCLMSKLKNLTYSFVIDNDKEIAEKAFGCYLLAYQQSHGNGLHLNAVPFGNRDSSVVDKAAKFLSDWAVKALEDQPLTMSSYWQECKGDFSAENSVNSTNTTLYLSDLSASTRDDNNHQSSYDTEQQWQEYATVHGATDLDRMMIEEQAKCEGLRRMVFDDEENEMITLGEFKRRTRCRSFGVTKPILNLDPADQKTISDLANDAVTRNGTMADEVPLSMSTSVAAIYSQVGANYETTKWKAANMTELVDRTGKGQSGKAADMEDANSERAGERAKINGNVVGEATMLNSASIAEVGMMSLEGETPGVAVGKESGTQFAEEIAEQVVKKVVEAVTEEIAMGDGGEGEKAKRKAVDMEENAVERAEKRAKVDEGSA
ncbi:hypothetical protein G7Y89_g6490 [Cudoniella acicularis]|uniref:Uncharacterized protein n=1 Tax=Cudoniella acicularis TaxID=354080 RepID=A0A8H4RMN3_9HELO|nr:hypothetical protein G7Y89_g6490 [Cudoniella acicularis]